MSIFVSHWCSHPDLDNDDCSTGEDFATEAEALAYYNTDPEDTGIEYIEIDISDAACNRLGITRCRKSGNYVPSKDTDDGNGSARMRCKLAWHSVSMDITMPWDTTRKSISRKATDEFLG